MKMAVGAAVFADSESVAAMVLHTGEAADRYPHKHRDGSGVRGFVRAAY